MKPSDYQDIYGYAESLDLLNERDCSNDLGTFIELVSTTVPNGASILDIGGGSGYILARILDSRQDLAATLLEPSEPMLERARTRAAGFAILEGSLQDQSDKLEQYDAIILCRALYAMSTGHQQRQATIRLISRKLKPYGRLFIHEPDALYDIASFETRMKHCLDMPPDAFQSLWQTVKPALERFNTGVRAGEFTLYDAQMLDQTLLPEGFTLLTRNGRSHVYRRTS